MAERPASGRRDRQGARYRAADRQPRTTSAGSHRPTCTRIRSPVSKAAGTSATGGCRACFAANRCRLPARHRRVRYARGGPAGSADPRVLPTARARSGGAGTAIPVPSGDVLIYSVEREYRYGPIERRRSRHLDALRPHLARAAHAVGAALDGARRRGATGSLAMLGLPAAVLQGAAAALDGDERAVRSAGARCDADRA